MLAIWSLFPLPFLNPAWTSGSSQVHVLLKPSLENFEHYFASMWNGCNCVVVWTFFGIAFFGIGMKTDLFQSCGHYWVFQICWHIECSTFTASSFRIWNSSTGIPSPLLALFVVMLPDSTHNPSINNLVGYAFKIYPLPDNSAASHLVQATITSRLDVWSHPCHTCSQALQKPFHNLSAITSLICWKPG